MKWHGTRNGVWLMTAVAMWFTPLAAPAAEEKKVRERGEIEPRYLWNLETTFASLEEWQKEYAAVEKQIEALAQLRGTLGQSDAALLAALQLRDDAAPRLERVYVYTAMLSDQDARISDNQALKARARALAVKYGEATSWMGPELTALPFEKLDGWMKQNQALAVYRHHFDNLFRQKKHILSPREEELLAMTGEVVSTPYLTYNLFVTADLQMPTILDADGNQFEVTDSAFYKLMRSPDRRVRHDGYEAITGSYAKFRNTAAALLNGVVQAHILNKKARGYPSCLEAALAPGNIPRAVYDNLVAAVNDNLPLLHRYTTLRRQALKLTDGVRDYDLYCPFVGKAELKYSYEEGVRLMLEALAPLGPEYLKIVREGVDSRWVDVYSTKGKRSGAYSSGTYLTQPYILMNYYEEYDDVSTLAHEFGHSVHSYLSNRTQPYVYADYDIFCAEVASTCNEILLQKYILPQIQDPQTKLYLLVEFLEGFRGTVFRQTKFSEFEQKIHEMAEQGTPLTADALGRVYGDLMKRYYGPDYTHDELTDNYWIRIPHFYYNFYVYKYATSFCAASNIARRVLAKEPGAVEAYLKFLKSGGSRYPLELLQDAGVDMTTPDYIRDAMKHFEELLDQTEELVRRMK